MSTMVIITAKLSPSLGALKGDIFLCDGRSHYKTAVGWAWLEKKSVCCTTLACDLSNLTLMCFNRFLSAKKTDKRVRIMNEVITGIRVIKMYAWEYAFRRIVKALRK